MLQNAARRLFGAASSQSVRAISTSAGRLSEAAQDAGPSVFTEKWNKQAPSNLAPPEFPTDFLPSASTESKVQGDLFPVNLMTPTGILSEAKQLDTVILPGVDGVFGVKANHVPVISQLRPGLVELHAAGEIEKYFISGGFAFVHPTGVTDICVAEAATLDQFDAPAVKAALAAAQGAQSSDDYEAAVNRAAVEVYAALDAALDSKA